MTAIWSYFCTLFLSILGKFWLSLIQPSHVTSCFRVFSQLKTKLIILGILYEYTYNMVLEGRSVQEQLGVVLVELWTEPVTERTCNSHKCQTRRLLYSRAPPQVYTFARGKTRMTGLPHECWWRMPTLPVTSCTRFWFPYWVNLKMLKVAALQ